MLVINVLLYGGRISFKFPKAISISRLFAFPGLISRKEASPMKGWSEPSCGGWNFRPLLVDGRQGDRDMVVLIIGRWVVFWIL